MALISYLLKDALNLLFPGTGDLHAVLCASARCLWSDQQGLAAIFVDEVGALDAVGVQEVEGDASAFAMSGVGLGGVGGALAEEDAPTGF